MDDSTKASSSVCHILHVDMDAFFVSVEQVRNPDLIGKPVIVGGRAQERHGVVCSASYEARTYGVRSGMPLVTALRLCPRAVVISTGHSNYIEYSHRLENILKEFSPLVEMASLDEAFIDITGTECVHKASPLGIAHALCERIQAELSLPSSCGVASSKVVAKIASKCAKPRGVLWIPQGQERSFLRGLEVEAMPGIGPCSAATLHKHGITTLGNIQDIGEAWMVKHFGSHGRGIFEHACGIDTRKVHSDDYRPKSVNRSYTFPRDLTRRDDINAALSYLSERIAMELRRLRARTATISLTIRYHDFRTISRSTTLTSPVDDESELLHTTAGLFKSASGHGQPVRLLGITAGELFYDTLQRDMFEPVEKEKKRRRLRSSIDQIKKRYGFDSIIKGTTFPYLDDE